MKFNPTLVKGKLLKRYKRFLADVILDSSGEKITAYVPNTGSMLSCLFSNAEVALSYHPDSQRKLPYTLEMINSGASWIGINTALTNNLVESALNEKIIKGLETYLKIQREVTIFKSRIDFLLEDANQKKLYLEVKNVSYKNEELKDMAQFPDAITTRGLKHLDDLINIKKSGIDSAIFYLIQREDCHHFSIAKHIDADYFEGFKKALNAGVKVFVYNTQINPQGIQVMNEIPWTI
jgi:sugar fermentation stimulation protein A